MAKNKTHPVKTADHYHSKHHKPTNMDKVKIKRVKRNKKTPTTAEKVMAGLGVGSTLLGGAGAVAPKPSTTQFVREQSNESGSNAGRVKDTLKKIFGATFGVQQAKASGDIVFANGPLASATVGQPYSADLKDYVSGGNEFMDDSFQLVGGHLPPGFTLNLDGTITVITGTVSGDAVGNYNFSVRVTDNGNHPSSATQTFTLNVTAAAVLNVGGGGGGDTAQTIVDTSNLTVYADANNSLSNTPGTLLINGSPVIMSIIQTDGRIFENIAGAAQDRTAYYTGQGVADQLRSAFANAPRTNQGGGGGGEEVVLRIATLGFTKNNNDPNTAVVKVGDSWKITITNAAPNTTVYVQGGKIINGVTPQDRTPTATTDANGDLTLTGIFSSQDIGQWVEDWQVGTNSIGVLNFSLQAADGGDTVAPPETRVGALAFSTSSASYASTGVVKVGDAWTVTIRDAEPNTNVYVVGGKDGVQARTQATDNSGGPAKTDARGNLTINGTFASQDIGQWVEDWQVGTTSVGVLNFNLQAADGSGAGQVTSAGTLTATNTTTNTNLKGATVKVGENWQITISGATAGTPVFVVGGKDGANARNQAIDDSGRPAVIGADGSLTLHGTFMSGQIGAWHEQWQVGTLTTDAFDFTIQAADAGVVANVASTENVTINLLAPGTNWSIGAVGGGFAEAGTSFSTRVVVWVQAHPQFATGTVTVNRDASGTIVSYVIDGTTYTPQALATAIMNIGRGLSNFDTLTANQRHIYLQGTAALVLPGVPFVYLTPATIYDSWDPSNSSYAGRATGINTFIPPSTYHEMWHGQLDHYLTPDGLATPAQGAKALAEVKKYYPNARLVDVGSGSDLSMSFVYGSDIRRDYMIVLDGGALNQNILTSYNITQFSVSFILQHLDANGNLPSRFPQYVAAAAANSQRALTTLGTGGDNGITGGSGGVTGGDAGSTGAVNGSTNGVVTDTNPAGTVIVSGFSGLAGIDSPRINSLSINHGPAGSTVNMDVTKASSGTIGFYVKSARGEIIATGQATRNTSGGLSFVVPTQQFSTGLYTALNDAGAPWNQTQFSPVFKTPPWIAPDSLTAQQIGMGWHLTGGQLDPATIATMLNQQLALRNPDTTMMNNTLKYLQKAPGYANWKIGDAIPTTPAGLVEQYLVADPNVTQYSKDHPPSFLWGTYKAVNGPDFYTVTIDANGSHFSAPTPISQLSTGTGVLPGEYFIQLYNSATGGGYIYSNNTAFTIDSSSDTSARGTLTFTKNNNDANTATVKVGDTWKITITGAAPNTSVYVVGGKIVNGRVPADRSPATLPNGQAARTDAQGNLTLTGTFAAADIGQWTENWQVGTSSVGTLNFNLVAADAGAGNGDGTILPLVTLSRSAVTMKVGETVTVNATPSAVTAVSTSGVGIVLISVNSTGVISIVGLAPGTATVTVHPTVLPATNTSQDKTITVTVTAAGSQDVTGAGDRTTSDSQTITQLQNQITLLQNRINELTAQLGGGSNSSQTAQIQSMQNQIVQLNNLVSQLRSGQITVLGNATGTANLQGLQMPASYTGGLQMPAGYDANATGQVQGAETLGTYTVKKGDTLWNIAKKYYGDGKQWRKILSANPSCLSIPGNTKTLKIGAVLNIPR